MGCLYISPRRFHRYSKICRTNQSRTTPEREKPQGYPRAGPSLSCGFAMDVLFRQGQLLSIREKYRRTRQYVCSRHYSDKSVQATTSSGCSVDGNILICDIHVRRGRGGDIQVRKRKMAISNESANHPAITDRQIAQRHARIWRRRQLLDPSSYAEQKSCVSSS